jgi:hypothetical protein
VVVVAGQYLTFFHSCSSVQQDVIMSNDDHLLDQVAHEGDNHQEEGQAMELEREGEPASMPTSGKKKKRRGKKKSKQEKVKKVKMEKDKPQKKSPPKKQEKVNKEKGKRKTNQITQAISLISFRFFFFFSISYSTVSVTQYD